MLFSTKIVNAAVQRMSVRYVFIIDTWSFMILKFKTLIWSVERSVSNDESYGLYTTTGTVVERLLSRNHLLYLFCIGSTILFILLYMAVYLSNFLSVIFSVFFTLMSVRIMPRAMSIWHVNFLSVVTGNAMVP